MARGNVRVSISGDADQLARETRAAERHIDRFSRGAGKGFKNLGGAAGVLDSRLGKLAKAASLVGGAYLAIAEGKEAVNTTTDLAKATIGLNKSLGLSVKQASQWAAVAKVRGIETKALNQAFGTLAKNVEAGTEKTSAQAKAFRQLGVSHKELKNLNFNQLLFETAEGMGKLDGGTNKTALAMKLFGRGWQTVVPVLRDGAKGMKEQLALADKYGATFGGKTINSMKEFIASQREAKFASLGLQVAFGTQVAPTLTKVINKVTQFVAEMRQGTGAGGRFADKAKDVADAVGDIVRPVGRVVGQIGQFVGKHPGIGKVAAAIVTVGLAIKAIRFAGALTGVDKLLGGFRKIAGTNAGVKAREAIASGLSGLWGKLKGTVSTAVSRLTGAFSTGGTVAGNKASKNIGTPITAASGKGGKLWTVFKGAGLLLGAVMATEIATKIIEEISGLDFGKIEGRGRGVGGGSGTSDLLPWNWRRGGRVGFARGGLVPSMLSPGELGVTPGGGAFKVPGPRTAADVVPMALPQDTAIFTGDGQRRLASGQNPETVLRTQLPHFAKGGKVTPGKYVASSYGPPWGGIQGTGVTRTGVDLRGNPHLYGIAVDPSRISLGASAKVWPNPFGTRQPFKAFDTGGAILGNRIDFYDWRGRSEQLGWGKRTVRVSPSSTRAGGGTETGIRQPRITKAARGFFKGLLPDAFTEGFTAGTEGTGLKGLLGSVFEASEVPASDLPRQVSRDVEGAGGGLGGGKLGRVRKMLRFGWSAAKRNLPYVYGGGHGPTPDMDGPWDCSGLVSAALHAGGFTNTTMTTDGLKGWGQSGDGKWVTVGVRGSTGAQAHTMIRVGNHYFESGGGGNGGHRRSSWNGDFPIKRHPAGFRRGGVVGDNPDPRIVGWGLRKGGKVKRPKTILGILNQLERAPRGTPAANLLRALPRVLRGYDYKSVATDAPSGIRGRLRRLAKDGLTGQERIVGRRLRGALSLLQGEQGRRLGVPVRQADTALSTIDRGFSRLDNQLRVEGIDPDSAAGIERRQALNTEGITTLTARRDALRVALRRAKKAGRKGVARQIREQLNTVDDSLLGLQGDQAELGRTDPAADALTQALEELKSTIEAHTAAVNQQQDNQKRLEQLINTQGPQTLATMQMLLSQGLGRAVGLARQASPPAGKAVSL